LEYEDYDDKGLHDAIEKSKMASGFLNSDFGKIIVTSVRF